MACSEYWLMPLTHYGNCAVLCNIGCTSVILCLVVLRSYGSYTLNHMLYNTMKTSVATQIMILSIRVKSRPERNKKEPSARVLYMYQQA